MSPTEQSTKDSNVGEPVGHNPVRARLRHFILGTFMSGAPPESLEDAMPLISSGIISSLALLEVVAFLEASFCVTLRQEDIASDRLNSIDQMVGVLGERGVAG